MTVRDLGAEFGLMVYGLGWWSKGAEARIVATKSISKQLPVHTLNQLVVEGAAMLPHMLPKPLLDSREDSYVTARFLCLVSALQNIATLAMAVPLCSAPALVSASATQNMS